MSADSQEPRKTNRAERSSSSKRRGRARPERRKVKTVGGWMEQRILMGTTGATLIGMLLQIVAISTDDWLILETGEQVQSDGDRQLVRAKNGLWRVCLKEVEAGNTYESCEPLNLFPDETDLQDTQEDTQRLGNMEMAMTQADYTRTAIAFTIIALLVMVIGHGFAFYALKRPRYIIKRLTALLHFMTAGCLLVLNEVFTRTIDQEKQINDKIPINPVSSHGFSFILSWVVFCIYVLAGIVFFWTSHKKKSEYADGEEALEDEPMEIRR